MKYWIILLLLAFSTPTLAEENLGTPLGADVATREQAHAKNLTLPPFTLHGITLKQNRNQEIPEDFKNPATRKCKPFCVEPEKLENTTLVKVDDFPRLAAELNAGTMLLVDMRTPEWYAKGTLPGAINLPYSDLAGMDSKATARMKKLGGKPIIAFCNGWWCGQSHTGIKALQMMDYPGTIHWFRGGNQDWLDAGLPLVKP